MDDEIQSLEAELRQLTPAAPSRKLEARIGRELASTAPSAPRTRLAIYWLSSAAIAAAAALAVGWVSFHPVSPRTPAEAASPAATSPVATASVEGPLKPVAAENVLIEASDEGFVTLDDGTTARRERLQFVDTITWKNPRTNASLRWSIPREEIRVVPVTFQ